MGAYPDGCTQAMHDRAHGSDDREACQTCDGTGHSDLFPGGECIDCNGSGYEKRTEAHERDYDPSEGRDVEF
jgi:DnaJ-class molecular chaperone